ncbi:hypothetical protein KKH43_03125 [Patescibacteria group bacterium]|nr:hypothetical protein [Patescibacteria group bacterium]
MKRQQISAKELEARRQEVRDRDSRLQEGMNNRSLESRTRPRSQGFNPGNLGGLTLGGAPTRPVKVPELDEVLHPPFAISVALYVPGDMNIELPVVEGVGRGDLRSAQGIGAAMGLEKREVGLDGRDTGRKLGMLSPITNESIPTLLDQFKSMGFKLVAVKVKKQRNGETRGGRAKNQTRVEYFLTNLAQIIGLRQAEYEDLTTARLNEVVALADAMGKVGCAAFENIYATAKNESFGHVTINMIVSGKDRDPAPLALKFRHMPEVAVAAPVAETPTSPKPEPPAKIIPTEPKPKTPKQRRAASQKKAAAPKKAPAKKATKGKADG